MPEPSDDARATWRVLLRLPLGTRWLLALLILFAAIALWLETAAPDHATPILLPFVGLAAVLCGAGPGACVPLGAALGIWWFALHVPGEAPSLTAAGARLLLRFLVASAAILAASAALRRIATRD